MYVSTRLVGACELDYHLFPKKHPTNVHLCIIDYSFSKQRRRPSFKMLSVTVSRALLLLAMSAVCQAVALDSSPVESCPADVSTCSPEFCQENDHVMCWRDSPDVISSGVSEDEIQGIVDKHNALRRQEFATDLFQLVWDPEVARIAEKNTRACQMVHDSNRRIPSYGLDIGQNIAAGYSSWDLAIQAWYDEVDNFIYGVGKKDEEKALGHFTQVVSNRTMRLGCGFSLCNVGMKRFYACNYARGNAYDFGYPYTKGNPASECGPSVNGLCDCQGKLCKNGGKLNAKTCECSCNEKYTGDECENEKCPGKVCQNDGTLRYDTCECICSSDLYTGDLCEINRCPGVTCSDGYRLDVDTCQCICEDKVDCENYIGDFCNDNVWWARGNCEVYCGFCDRECLPLYTMHTCQLACLRAYLCDLRSPALFGEHPNHQILLPQMKYILMVRIT